MAGSQSSHHSSKRPVKPRPEKPLKSDFDPFKGIAKKMPAEEEKKPEQKVSKVLLTQASVKTFLYEKSATTEQYLLRPVTVSMKARSNSTEEQGSAVKISATANQENIRSKISNPVLDLVASSLEDKPAPGRIEIKPGSKPYSYSRNGDNLSGAAFVLTSSAFSGDSPSGTIIVRLDENGNPVTPTNFWNILRDMKGTETGRLIIPASAEKFLLSLLTMEQKSFFLRYEVLMASTPEELLALSSSKPSPEYAAAFAEFKAIREKSKGIAVGSYVANRFVLQRLRDLSAKAPYHLSAKLLATQGAGERPRALTRDFVAAELLRIIEPARPVVKFSMQNATKANISTMNDIQRACRDSVEGLDRLTDIRDRDLLEATKDLATSLRSVARELSKNGEYWENYSDIESAKKDFDSRLESLRKNLIATASNPSSGE